MSVLIITGTIKPVSNINATILVDAETRRKQYEQAIIWFIRNSEFTKIIFCENSMEHFGLENIYEELNANPNIKFEFLQFTGDEKGIQCLGKGYGEGEIMEYVLNHSSLLADEKYFYKITGRVIIKNINQILEKNSKERFAYAITKWGWMFTWFYGMKIQTYNKYFSNIYKDTSDRCDKVLESMWFAQGLNRNMFYWTNYNIYPEIIGQAGSSGERYETLFEKQKKKLINNKFLCLKTRLKVAIANRVRKREK